MNQLGTFKLHESAVGLKPKRNYLTKAKQRVYKRTMLNYITEHSDATQQEIADYMGLKIQQTTKLLTEALKKGEVAKTSFRPARYRANGNITISKAIVPTYVKPIEKDKFIIELDELFIKYANDNGVNLSEVNAFRLWIRTNRNQE